MRVVVVGATGNVGTSLLEALVGEPAVDSVLGLARRLPKLELPKVEWARAHVARDDLVPHFRGADCVVHLAWKIQPSPCSGTSCSPSQRPSPTRVAATRTARG